MNALKRFAKRTMVVLGVAALGFAGVSAGANADETLPGNIDSEAIGSIIIHKHEEDNLEGPPTGKPLEGVTFRVTEILHDGHPVPLATVEGWESIETLTVGGVDTAPFSRGVYAEVTTDQLGLATAQNLGVGLYLVEEIGSGPNLIATPAAPFLVTIPYPTLSGAWDYNVDVYPKNVLGSIAPTKTVGEPDSPADVVLGAIVPFTISVPVANPALDYVSFTIEDVLSPGLEFESWGAISVGGSPFETADYTISADDTTVTLTETGLAKLNTAAKSSPDGTTVTAVINAEVMNLGRLHNTATVMINGEPGETPEVTTNWARLDITKVDEATGVELAGAEFELYKKDKTTLLATGTTNDDGELSFNVWVGNNDDVTEVVYLKETVAPAGYVLPAEPWFGPYTLTAGETAEASITPMEIDNYKPEGPELPLTGAQGTLLMTITGLVLAGAGGGALAVSRRRKTE